MNSTRRDVARLLGLLPLLALLPGCGFHPVYARTDAGAAGPAAEGLAAISVALIPERTGQLLRQDLQERFERNGLARAHRYDLGVSYSVAADAIGVQQDSSVSLIRFTASANYTLTAQDTARSTLFSGMARTVDEINLFGPQAFATYLESEAVQRRLAEAIADQIAAGLASYFAKRALAADSGR